MRSINAVFGMLLLSLLAGCGPTPPNLAHDVAAQLTFTGLSIAGQKAPDTAKKTAGEVQAVLNDAVIPYVQSNQGAAYSVLQIAIDTNLTKNLGFVEIFGANFLAKTIDQAVNIKNPLSKLSAAQLATLVSSLQGIADGCGEYLTPAALRPAWRSMKVSFEPTRTSIRIDYPAAEIVELPPIALAYSAYRNIDVDGNVKIEGMAIDHKPCSVPDARIIAQNVTATDGSELTMRCKEPRYYAADATQGTGVVTYTRCTRGGCCGGSWRAVYREKPGQLR